ncbi:MAG: hypothetical protein KDA78_03230, partial [Planctomycetaceae bacterium]|nr:hypothetical protein [Planctomycetaceae bacterium]
AMLPLVERTRGLGCKLGLYNHGGWGGEPQNLISVCEYLRRHHQAEHVGIVYNLHHGHGHIDDFADVLEKMKPYLLCLNLNGMTRNGDQIGQKILPLGAGEFDLPLLKIIRDSGYAGPIGIIGHTQDDVAERLQDNLDGLHWLTAQLDGTAPGPKPKYRTLAVSEPSVSHKMPGVLLPGNIELGTPPFTLECVANLPDAQGYNILVAHQEKRSGQHWELFSMNGSGELTVYLPGCQPDHVRSKMKICDGQVHRLGMIYEPQRVQLFVDGKQVADQQIQSQNRAAQPGGLGIGRLVEGTLGCRGEIAWVHLSRGIQTPSAATEEIPVKTDQTLVLWTPDSSLHAGHGHSEHDHSGHSEPSGSIPEYSAEAVQAALTEANEKGDRHRGLMVFARAKTACVSCHKIGKQGGEIGPDLSRLARERKPQEIIESIFWPQRTVKPEFVAHLLVDLNGLTHQGFVVSRDEKQIVLKTVVEGNLKERKFAAEEIEAEKEVGSLMPDNLAAVMSHQDQSDLFAFLLSLGTDKEIPIAERDQLLFHAVAHREGPAKFPYTREPLEPELWPSWEHHVNRDRVYDFYAKEADYFSTQEVIPPVMQEYPGLDGGTLGHWGNQDDTVWADDRWNQTVLGSVMSGVFRNGKQTVPRAVCIHIDETPDKTLCFDPDQRAYVASWSGGFVQFESFRHGFLGGLKPSGEVQTKDLPESLPDSFRYRGFYRVGKQICFAYEKEGEEWLDLPVYQDGKWSRELVRKSEHSLRERIQNPPVQWPEIMETEISLGSETPWAIDRIGLPFTNPWNALMFCGGHAFLPDGSALVCTMQGDVWRVTDFEYPSKTAKWKRFASGLHHPQGIWIDADGIFVLGRDQITRLHDLNGDAEADFYECFSSAFITSPAGHDFICGLERDAAGNFYTASGNQGVVRISPDGRSAQVIATGFRNPDGIGLHSEGIITIPCSEGSWTPASMICAMKASDADRVPYFGFGGPRDGNRPDLPLVYLPRGVDNSSGGQIEIVSRKWSVLNRRMLHFSFGTGAGFLLLHDEVHGQLQGAVVPLPGEFRSGAHRGRFSLSDGELYVTGMQGWGSYTPDDGCFERRRVTAEPEQYPLDFHLHRNGVLIRFSTPLEKSIVEKSENHFAQCWNYRYSAGYGSPEFSAAHYGMRGHDHLVIQSAHLIDDRTLFLEIPELQPVNQLHLRLHTGSANKREMFITAHELDEDFARYPGYVKSGKQILPHPILADLAMATRSIPNPHTKRIKEARRIMIETGSNLSYATPVLRARAGESLELTLSNPDVVPHNWVLVQPGCLEEVGHLSDQGIADPEAVLRHYVPESPNILAYCDVVLPHDMFTIYFQVPKTPGNYPFLCTFPGHWKIMNGVLVVE